MTAPDDYSPALDGLLSWQVAIEALRERHQRGEPVGWPLPETEEEG